MILQFRSLVLLVLMLSTSAMAISMRPMHKLADEGPKVDLETMIPQIFGEWREVKQAESKIIDPVQQETINRIYSKTLSRTYVHPNGEKIMLSIAYSDDQRDSKQTHYPEVCYPSQGFQVISKHRVVLEIPGGRLPLQHIETSRGTQRYEPVTYWVMIGETAVLSGLTKKIAEMRYGLSGLIPDGMLVRISSIDNDSQRAFQFHKVFITEILAAMSPPIRKKFSGT